MKPIDRFYAEKVAAHPAYKDVVRFIIIKGERTFFLYKDKERKIFTLDNAECLWMVVDVMDLFVGKTCTGLVLCERIVDGEVYMFEEGDTPREAVKALCEKIYEGGSDERTKV